MTLRGLAAALGMAVVLAACAGPPVRTYATWATTGERPPKATHPAPEAELPPGVVPWAGTVSHHLLADSLIDRWFAELARVRKVEVFYLLSPSHWDLSVQPVSLTEGRWAVAGGFVESDRDGVSRVAGRLKVPLEPRVFDPEHGVSTLMPYLARYFPKAKVVVLATRGDPPVDQPLAERIAQALAPEFDAAGRGRNFLLVSADFAHHGNAEGVAFKDDRSRKFFAQPAPDRWIFVGCDNRPGLYSLAHLLGPADQSTVLFHSDSWRLSGADPNDITSYFFTYFWTPAVRDSKG